MRNTFWDKKIPTLLGLALIVVGIAITTALVKTGVIVISKASPSETPKNVRTTNISDTSATISYTTDASVIGSVNFGKDKNFGLTGLDLRDQQGKVTPHTTHYITLRNLSEKTSYFFSINSGRNTFLNDDVPFELTTGPTIEDSPSSQEPLTGNVILPDGSRPNEGVVYVTLENGQTISILLKEDGSFILPLNSLRTTNLSSYMTFSKDTIIKMLVANNTFSSSVLLSPLHTNPLPPITLSLDYDFTTQTTPVASRAAAPVGFPTFSAKEVSSTKPEISTPKKDQGFSDTQPLFKGKANPLEKIQIIIRSTENIQTEVVADNSGNWTYRPANPLSPGSHTITITTKDPSGILKKITQSFTVFAQGSQVTEPATPSSSLTPSPAPSLTPTPTLVPTPIPTVQPTIIPTPTLAPPGNSQILPLGITAVATTAVGIILFLLTRKASL